MLTEVVEDMVVEERQSRQPVVPMDDLIKKVDVTEVEGMDDRVSLSSDDSMIIHDEKPKKGILRHTDNIVSSIFSQRCSSLSCTSSWHALISMQRIRCVLL